MDTEKFKMGWVVLTVSGKVAQETAKLRRFVVKLGAQKLAPQTYALPCVRGLDGLATLVASIKDRGAKETSVRAIYVTRAQWERSFVVHGPQRL